MMVTALLRSPSSFNSLNKFGLLILGLLSLVVAVLFIWIFSGLISFKITVHHLTIAAGSSSSESYILSQAIAQVVKAHYPNLHIQVQETSGSIENLQRLELSKAQLATVQADIPVGPTVRAVAVLYPDLFQWVVQDSSGIRSIPDLKGKRVGLPQQGGQFQSFLEVTEHYGLELGDVQVVGQTEHDAIANFRQGLVDATFRVCTLGNPSIRQMVQQYQGQLLPIEQAAAMRIRHPAFEPAMIPKGAYRGKSPMPETDLPTVAIRRLLVANKQVNHLIIQAITKTLYEHRRELVNAIPPEFADIKPLIANITQPATVAGTGLPVHQGASAYYDRNKPSYIKNNADLLGLLLTAIVLIGSWLWELKAWIERRNRAIADEFVKEVVAIVNLEPECLSNAQQQLDEIFMKAAKALVEEQISQESFRTFNEAYKTVREVLERHPQRLRSHSQAESVQTQTNHLEKRTN